MREAPGCFPVETPARRPQPENICERSATALALYCWSGHIRHMLAKPSGAPAYVLGHLWGWQHRKLTTWALELMDVQPTDRILDVGCGVGMALVRLQRAAAGGFVAGLDHSQTMAKLAARRTAAAIARHEVAVVCGDALALPWADRVFDRVCAIETFYYWPDALRGVREACRVLKPGGQLAIVMEASKDAPLLKWAARDNPRCAGARLRLGFRMYSSAEMTAMAQEAGFSEVRCETKARSLGWLCCLARK
jgi:SAM-dependent methyltransferase